MVETAVGGLHLYVRKLVVPESDHPLVLGADGFEGGDFGRNGGCVAVEHPDNECYLLVAASGDGQREAKPFAVRVVQT